MNLLLEDFDSSAHLGYHLHTLVLGHGSRGGRGISAYG